MVNVSDECLVFYMTESTWKILKLDWKTHGFFQKSANHVKSSDMHSYVKQ